MVSVLSFQTEEWGFNPRAVHYFFFFFFFFFLLLFCLRNIYYHIRALNATPINATSNLFCLYALRFSAPVNNFMSCVAGNHHILGIKQYYGKLIYVLQGHNLECESNPGPFLSESDVLQHTHRTLLRIPTVRSRPGPPIHAHLYVDQ